MRGKRSMMAAALAAMVSLPGRADAQFPILCPQDVREVTNPGVWYVTREDGLGDIRFQASVFSLIHRWGVNDGTYRPVPMPITIDGNSQKWGWYNAQVWGSCWQFPNIVSVIFDDEYLGYARRVVTRTTGGGGGEYCDDPM